MRRDSDHERFATQGGLVLGQLRAASAQLTSGAFAMEKRILVQTMCHTPGRPGDTVYHEWTLGSSKASKRAKQHRDAKNSRGNILTNSYALVASGGKVRGDKSFPGLMKINKLKVSEMKDVLAVRCQPLEFQFCTHNSVAVCLASYFPALGPEFLF